MKTRSILFRLLRDILLLGIGMLLTLYLLSCSPARRLQRMEKRHPELFQDDSVKQQHSGSDSISRDTGKLVHGIDSIEKAAVDSIRHLKTTDSAGCSCDSLRAACERLMEATIFSVKKKAVEAYKSAPCIAQGDTLTYKYPGLMLRIWQADGKIQHRVEYIRTLKKQPKAGPKSKSKRGSVAEYLDTLGWVLAAIFSLLFFIRGKN